MSEPVSYGGNSNKAKRAAEEAPKLEKLVTGEVTERKPSVGHKFRQAFAGEDAQSVGQHILLNVVVPTVQSFLLDIIWESATRFIGGGASTRRPGGNRFVGSGVSSSYTPYGKTYSGRSDEPGQRPMVGARDRRDATLAEFVFETKAEADDVLLALEEYIKVYNAVSVGAFYDAIGKTAPYTDLKYGWTDLREASVQRLNSGGYALNLPKAEQIK